jgi:molybdenum cofactor cytidylyltransferase
VKELLDSKWATIVLAAGSSSRMGNPKQLIKIEGETLIQKAIKSSIDAGATHTVVVLGAKRAEIIENLKNFPVRLIINSDWEKGMGNSLKFGIEFITNHFPDVDFVMILVCDQPFVNATHIKKIVEEYQKTKAPIVASYYSEKNGVPALFHKSFFKDLLAIDDQQGAKKIIEQNAAIVKSIDFSSGVIDLDTPEDLKKFYEL